MSKKKKKRAGKKAATRNWRQRNISTIIAVFLWLLFSGFGYVWCRVQVVQLGFGLSALCMVWLWVVPGDPAACLALAGALGLVQGATFAAIPQLNLTVLSRTYSQGALAQMGNLGNVLGTPLFVLLLAVAGFSGMALVMVLTLLGGLAIHALLAYRRRHM